MRILFLSDVDGIGGAGIAAARLASGLAGLGHEILWAVSDPRPERGKRPGRVVKLASASPVTWDRTPDPKAEAETLGRLNELLLDFRPDAVSVHNLHGGIKSGWCVEMVAACAAKAPTVWTLHDAWSFTGRCAYPGDCAAYLDGCGNFCPGPGEYPFCPPDRIAQAYERKKAVLGAGLSLGAVSPSAWLANLAEQGLWRGAEVRVIANGLDLDVYRPVDPASARRELGLETEGMVVLAATRDFNDRRKGADILVRALSLVRARPLTVVFMGGNVPRMHVDGVRTVDMGFVSRARQKALVYSAADCFLHPATEDNLPNTVAESLACGVPCVCMGTGGLPDLVVEGVTGRMAGEPTAVGLASALDKFFRDPARGADMRMACRQRAESHYEQGRQAGKYIEFFEHLSGGSRAERQESGWIVGPAASAG